MQPMTSTIERAKRDGARLPYMGGLDGLRAFAVIAVLLYHAGLAVWGGFLGVETFFVLSGFLITALLLAEWDQNGAVSLQDFWVRRAKRLLPALGFVLLGVLAIAAMLPAEETFGLKRDILASLGYAMNWRLVLSEGSYFDPTSRPSLVQHLWSLAVEEQFYIIWPLLFVVGMRYLRRWGLLFCTLAAIAASTALMSALYAPGVDPSRVYYGTDTRAAGLLIGVALALVWQPGRIPAANRRVVGVALDGIGMIALAGLVACFALLSEGTPWLYRGGLTMVAVLTALVIAAVTHPQARVMSKLLGAAPLRWIGMRSYGLYLWHWPIFQITRPYLDVPIGGYPLLALQLVAVFALTELSYRLIELPVRRGALRPLWQALHSNTLLPAVQFAAPHRMLIPQRGVSVSFMSKQSNGFNVPRRKHRRLHLVFSGLLIFTTGCATTGSAPVIPPTTELAAANTTVPTLAASIAATTVAPPTAAAISAPPTAAATQAAEAPTVAEAPTTPPTSVPAPTDALVLPAPTAATTATAAMTETTIAALQPFDEALAAELQRVLDATVADGFIPGAAISVSIPGYEPWVGVSGIASRKQGTPMEPNTRMRIASISKMFTSVVVLQLVEEGKIALDAPMSRYLPDLLRNGDAITVRELLQNHTGLYDYLEDRNFAAQAYGKPDRVFAPRELVTYAGQRPALFKPGAQNAWDYSSTNFVILGMIVEQVTGRTMGEEVQSRIFDPVGMTNAVFELGNYVEGQAGGYNRTVDQTFTAMSFAFATANIVAPVDETRRFGEALFNGKLLKNETMNEMLTFLNGKGQYNMPALEYGLGVMRNRLATGVGSPEASRVLGHIGGFGGFRSALWHAPDSGITVALGLNQGATDPNLLATAVYKAILTHQAQ